MAIPAPSLPSQRLRPRLAKRPSLGLSERRDAIAREWGSPARLLAGAAVCGAVALVVTLGVLALVLTSSLLWAPLLLVCLLAWVGMLHEFGIPTPLRRRKRAETAVAAAAEAVPAEPAPAAPAPRRRTQATAQRKPRPKQA